MWLVRCHSMKTLYFIFEKDDRFPEFYKRYIDYVFGATLMFREDHDTLISFVCDFHQAFHYTFEVSEESVNF